MAQAQKNPIKVRNMVAVHGWNRGGSGAHKSGRNYTRKVKHRNRET